MMNDWPNSSCFTSLLRCKTKAHFKNYQKGKKEIIEKDISDKDPEFKRRKKSQRSSERQAWVSKDGKQLKYQRTTLPSP